jgi:transmembrane sensor
MNEEVRRTAATDDVEEMAVCFFARQRSGDAPETFTMELETWLKADARNRLAFDRVSQQWSALEALRSEPSMLLMRGEALETLRSRRRDRRIWGALAASLLAVISCGALWSFREMDIEHREVQLAYQQYSTEIGKISTIVLPDKSLAILDTDTVIRSYIGNQGPRRVQLLRGRALFSVAKHADRPFSVIAADTKVTALGTRFDVYKMQGGLKVNLLEGHLRVDPRLSSEQQASPASRKMDMKAGDQLIVTRYGWKLSPGAADHVDWAKGQLRFDNVPVSEIVSELCRYTPTKLKLADREVGSRRVSAIIRTDNPLTFLRAIEVMGVARVKETSDGFQIMSY